MPDEEIDIETQPFTDSTGTYGSYDRAPQSSGKMPPLNVARAQHILNKFTEDPSWLANPRTAHAANAIFGAATKIIGMNTQLERVNASVEASQARNGIARDVGRNLLKMQMMGGDAARTAAKWNALGEDGKPLWQDSTHWSAILADSAAIEQQKAAEEQRKQDIKTKGQIDVGEARHENVLETNKEKLKGQKELEAIRYGHRIDLTGTREQNAEKLAKFKAGLEGGTTDKSVLVTERDPVTGSTVSRRMSLADAEQLPAMADPATKELLSKYASEKAEIESGDQSVGPDWMHLSNRAKSLAELKTKIEQKGINPDTGRKIGVTSPPAAAAIAPSEDIVTMTNPQGQTVKVPQSDVERAKKLGYK